MFKFYKEKQNSNWIRKSRLLDLIMGVSFMLNMMKLVNKKAHLSIIFRNVKYTMTVLLSITE